MVGRSGDSKHFYGWPKVQTLGYFCTVGDVLVITETSPY